MMKRYLAISDKINDSLGEFVIRRPIEFFVLSFLLIGFFIGLAVAI